MEPTNLRRLGKSDLMITNLGWGMWRFAGIDVKAAQELVESVFEAGINFFDTADIYGFQNPQVGFGDAEALLGEVFKQVNAGCPLKGFLLATQRVFLAGYTSCMNDDNGKPMATAEGVRRCVAVVRERTAELETQALAKVYTGADAKFTHEDLAILVYSVNGRQKMRLWGNWMPDAYNPKPFPDGKLCDLDDELKPAKGGFMTGSTDDAVFSVSEAAVQISEHIMCTPRNGIAPGAYRRVR